MELCFGLEILLLLYIVYRLLDWLYRKPMVGGYASKYILITGCDSGFGHQVAKKLDTMGCNVFAACLTEAGETSIRKATSSRTKTVHLDVTKHDSVLKAFEYVKKALPPGKGLWGILNNAGIANVAGPVEFFHLDDYQECMNVNLLGLIDVTTTFMPLIKQERGRIVNVSSMCGRFSLPSGVPYNVTKYGVESFSDCLRREMTIWGVKVSLIEPGFHGTNIADPNRLREVIWKSYENAPPDAQKEYGRHYIRANIEHQVSDVVKRIVSHNIMRVVDADIHALLAKHPRARYLLGWDANLLFMPIQRLPEWLGDWILALIGKDPLPGVLDKRGLLPTGIIN